MTSLYTIPLITIDHHETSLETYRSKTLLIVNVASQCGFTSQYKELEALYQKYKAKGLVILGFPCNQFGFQESGSDEEIAQFCSQNYQVSFPLFSKISVNGKEAHPLYQHLKQEQRGILGTRDIKWNFTKFLVSKEGEVLKRFASTQTPFSCEEEILKVL